MDPKHSDKFTEIVIEPSNRRDFLKGTIAAFAATYLLGNPALASALEIEVTNADGTPAKKAVGMKKPEALNADDWVDPPLVKPYLNERFEFRISFLSIKTAKGVITLKRTGRNAYTASMEGTISGMVGAVTDYRKVVMTSVMQVREINGKPRFVAQTFYRKTIKVDGERVSRHDYNYLKRTWIITKTRNGKVTSRKKRRIKKNQFYDDFVCIMYNFRSSVYGAVKPGFDVKVTTLPLSRRVEVNGKKKRKWTNWARIKFVAPAQQSGVDKKFMKDTGADFMVEVSFDPDVYGIKSGKAEFYGKLATMEPVGVRGKDVLLFGDVVAERVK